MSVEREVRDGAARDLDALEALYAEAFPGEDLWPLVEALLREPSGVLSLVATEAGAPVGHAAFTTCRVGDGAVPVALLGPLAVAPARQRLGIGGALVRAGLSRLGAAGVGQALVLGDPAYYGRFGFAPEADVAPPYPLPPDWREAWRSLRLGPGDGPPAQGRLFVPAPWRRPELWAQ